MILMFRTNIRVKKTKIGLNEVISSMKKGLFLICAIPDGSEIKVNIILLDPENVEDAVSLEGLIKRF